MSGINIPGVTDQYNTNETVEKLMKVERIPLTREQDTLKSYQTQQNAWRDINKKMSALRDSVKTLYSYDSPFSSKLAASTDENAVSATAGHNAQYESFKIDILQPATADRFLSSDLDSDLKIPAGTYIFKSADKTLTLNWKGGTLSDFSTALNKRGGETFKSSLLGAGEKKKTLLIESLKTGKANNLTFDGDAEKFAESIGMISSAKSSEIPFGTAKSDYYPAPVPAQPVEEQAGLPAIEPAQIQDNGTAAVAPRTGFSLAVPAQVQNDQTYRIAFSVTASKTDDITGTLNNHEHDPKLPEAGGATFQNFTVENFQSDTQMPTTVFNPVTTAEVVFAVMPDGTEKTVAGVPASGTAKVSLDIKDYPGIKSIVVRNRNTGTSYTLSSFSAFKADEASGYKPLHPVTTADDAVIKYEGITIHRPSNKIDDVVPDITLTIHDKTEKTATITIKPDTEASKQALITFVGKYNQSLAEINILSQTKPEIIDELDYLTDDEKKAERDRLGLFQGDFTLTSMKSSLQNIVSSKYSASDNSTVTMLSQLGISTNATNNGGSYSENRMRGYLEIDEKKLDSLLADNMDSIRNLFGYDSNGDLIIDAGIGFQMDQQLTAYTQTNGIISMRTNSYDSKIKTSETRIARLETQLDEKEQQLREQYSKMQSSLNSLENQQNSISNFTKQNSGSD